MSTKVENTVAPTSEQKLAYFNELFKGIPDDQPTYMLNMIAFNEVAKYPAGHEFEKRGLSGKDAYEEYGRHVGLLLDGLGVTVIGGWEMGLMVAGPESEVWDSIFVVRYESAKDFIGMITSDEYAKIELHRSAAVKDSWLVRMSDGQRLVDAGSAAS